MSKTQDQIRAGHAWNAVVEWNRDREKRSEKRSECTGLPSMLKTNGLLAGWAFLCTSEKRVDLAEKILEYFKQADAPSNIRSMCSVYGSAAAAYRGWIQAQNLDLRALTDEAIAFAVWLKRAAEIQIPR